VHPTAKADVRTKKRSQGELSKTAGRAHGNGLGKHSALAHKLPMMSHGKATDTGRIDVRRMYARSTRPRSTQCETVLQLLTQVCCAQADMPLVCSYASTVTVVSIHDATRGMTFEKDKGKQRATAVSDRASFLSLLSRASNIPFSYHRHLPHRFNTQYIAFLRQPCTTEVQLAMPECVRPALSLEPLLRILPARRTSFNTRHPLARPKYIAHPHQLPSRLSPECTRDECRDRQYSQILSRIACTLSIAQPFRIASS